MWGLCSFCRAGLAWCSALRLQLCGAGWVHFGPNEIRLDLQKCLLFSVGCICPPCAAPEAHHFCPRVLIFSACQENAGKGSAIVFGRIVNCHCDTLLRGVQRARGESRPIPSRIWRTTQQFKWDLPGVPMVVRQNQPNDLPGNTGLPTAIQERFRTSRHYRQLLKPPFLFDFNCNTSGEIYL